MWLERRDTCLPEISDSLKQANGALRGQPEGRTKLEELDYIQASCACLYRRNALLRPSEGARQFGLRQSQRDAPVPKPFDQASVVESIDRLSGHGRRRCGATRNLWGTYRLHEKCVATSSLSC